MEGVRKKRDCWGGLGGVEEEKEKVEMITRE